MLNYMYLEKRFDFSVESPPLPVPQLEVGSTVPLEDADSIQLLDSLLVVPEIILSLCQIGLGIIP